MTVTKGRSCIRCGVDRALASGYFDICRDCHWVIYDQAGIEPEPLIDGYWRQVGMKRVWVDFHCEDCGDVVQPGDRCDTCLTWAVKNARDHLWAQMSWSNRGRIWDVLPTRNDKELMTA